MQTTVTTLRNAAPQSPTEHFEPPIKMLHFLISIGQIYRLQPGVDEKSQIAFF